MRHTSFQQASERYPDSWVDDGCAMARRLLGQGHRERAAEVLRYIERKALALTRADDRRTWGRLVRGRGCSVRDCTRQRISESRPWCHRHAVRFDEEAA